MQGHCQVPSPVSEEEKTLPQLPRQVQAAHKRKAARTLAFQAVCAAQLREDLRGPLLPGPRDISGHSSVLRVMAISWARVTQMS